MSWRLEIQFTVKLPITELITCNCSFIAKLWAENYFLKNYSLDAPEKKA